MVVTSSTKYLDVKDLHDLIGPVAASRDSCLFAIRAPGVRPSLIGLGRPMKANRDARAHGIDDVLANERFILKPMRAAMNFACGAGHDAF